MGSWKEVKDNVYQVVGTERRDELERDFESFKSACFLKKPERKALDTATACRNAG